jgi:cutinase
MRTSIIAGLLATGALALPEPQLGKGKGKLGGGGAVGGCKKVTLIYARGTTEFGTMGQTVGPALQRALQAKFPGQVSVMGVQYPADMGGAVSGAINPAAVCDLGFKKRSNNRQAKGAIDMAKKARSVLQRCPDSRIVLSGYSQGAEQVHGALAKSNLGELGAKIAVCRYPIRRYLLTY